MALSIGFVATNSTTSRDSPYESMTSVYTAAGPDVRKTRTLKSLVLDVSILNKVEGL